MKFSCLIFQELPSYQSIRGTMLNSTVNIGSNQINEWILPTSFCYGPSVALNFNSGYFALYSSNVVKTVVQSFRKEEDTVTSMTAIPSTVSTAIQQQTGDPQLTNLTLPLRNIQFPIVELYAPDDTQSNVSTEVFIASNCLVSIHLLINFGDGKEKRFDNFFQSNTTSHLYQKTGNMTIQLRAFYREQLIFVGERFIIVLERNCFHPTPMFDIQHSVRSNPLMIFMGTEIVIKSRKRYSHHLKGCRPPSSDHIIFSWELTNADTREERNTTIGQLKLTSQILGLLRISLRILAGNFSTSGILYANFIYPREIDMRVNVSCRRQNITGVNCLCDYAVGMQQVLGRNISYQWGT